MRVVFAAGGTGGHIMPALAVAEALRKLRPETEILFIGVGKELEKKLIQGAGYKLEILPFTPVVGKGVSGLLRALCGLPSAVTRARRLLADQHIRGILAFGGYPSVVPVCAAFSAGLPRALHEQNVQVGRANQFLSLLVQKIFAVPSAHGFWQAKIVEEFPNPVRQKFLSVSDFKLPSAGEPWNLLVTGGSQGAMSLNDAVVSLSDYFRERNIRVRHQAGAQDAARVREAYAHRGAQNVEVLEFIEDMSLAYEWAHLVVSRAGALSVAEIQASGRPAFYVPLAIAQGHQTSNVIQTAIHGAGLILPQSANLGPQLRDMLTMLLDAPEKISAMAKAARELGRPAGGGSSASAIAQGFLELCEKKNAVV